MHANSQIAFKGRFTRLIVYGRGKIRCDQLIMVYNGEGEGPERHREHNVIQIQNVLNYVGHETESYFYLTNCRKKRNIEIKRQSLPFWKKLYLLVPVSNDKSLVLLHTGRVYHLTVLTIFGLVTSPAQFILFINVQNRTVPKNDILSHIQITNYN